MGFFDSPREQQGPGMYQGQLQGFDDILNSLKGMNSSYSGINTTGDVMSKFGLKSRSAKDVSQYFNPARANLSTQLALANKRTAARMGGTNATPELSFGGNESNYATARGNLEDTATQTGLQTEESDQQNIANILNSIMGKKDTYGLQKTGMQISGQSARGKSVQDYINSLSNASGFDDLMSLLGTGAGIYGAATKH